MIERSLLDRWKVRRDDKNGRAWVAGTAEWFRPMQAGNEQPAGPSGIRFTLDTLETRRMVIRYTLRKIANGRPLLFWLDDLHNAAPTTYRGLAADPRRGARSADRDGGDGALGGRRARHAARPSTLRQLLATRCRAA